MLPLSAAIARLGGVATLSQLRGRGYSVRAVASAVRAGSIERVRRAHYAIPDAAADARIAVRLGGRLGSISAARSYGWWTGTDDRVHVSWAPHGNVALPGRLELPGVVRHWRIRHPSLPSNGECWRESPEATIAQVLATAPREHAIACANSATRSGMLSVWQVHGILGLLPRVLHDYAELIDGRPDSGLEDLVRTRFTDLGIPFMLHPYLDGHGLPDFRIGRSLLIEVDGDASHGGSTRTHRDRARDAASDLRHYSTIRWSYRQVMFDWPTCVAQLLERMGRGDHLRYPI